MATSTIFTEEKFLNVYWKIKNFSYFFKGEISSPKFKFSHKPYWLSLKAGDVNIECSLRQAPIFESAYIQTQMSFLTCDGSQKNYTCFRTLTVPKDAILIYRRNAFLPEDTLTVHLRFETSYNTGNIFISSQIGVKIKYFLWTLKVFGKNYSSTKSVESSETYGDIELKLNKTGGCNSEKQFYVEVTRKGGERCYYTLKISVLDSKGNALNEISGEHVFEKQDGLQVKGFPLFIKMKQLFERKNLVLSGDTLSLKCCFAISLGTLADQTVYSYCDSVKSLANELKHLSAAFKGKTDSGFATDELQSDLKSILDCGTLGDVSLKIDTEVIKVHKVILSARSPVFKAMFTKDMQETINNTVVIEDLDLETVRGLVLYMYTDTISDCNSENIRKLYAAADKYEVRALKNKCISCMKTNLAISNVCEVLLLADLHQDNDLKTVTFDFISENSTKIFAEDAWKNLEELNSKLALEIMHKVWSKKHILN